MRYWLFLEKFNQSRYFAQTPEASELTATARNKHYSGGEGCGQ